MPYLACTGYVYDTYTSMLNGGTGYVYDTYASMIDGDKRDYKHMLSLMVGSGFESSIQQEV